MNDKIKDAFEKTNNYIKDKPIHNEKEYVKFLNGWVSCEQSKQKDIRKSFEDIFDVPDYLHFDGEDYMYYEEDPLLIEQCQSIRDQYRGFKTGCEI